MGFSLKIRRSETNPPNFYLYFTFVFTIIQKKIFACGGLVFTLSLPLFLPLLLILCLPCILPLFDLYFTLVFSFILLLCLPWFCFLPSIVTYQAAEAFACRRNQLLLAKWPKFCESRNRIPNFFIFCVCVAVAACVWVCARKLRKPSKDQENMQIHKKLFGFYSREGV